MAEHTPGPWEAREKFYIHAAGHTGSIAEVKCCFTLGPESPQHEANARLIAAAPELLTACKAFAQWFDGWCSNSRCCAHSGLPVHEQVLEAIARAEGRDPNPQPEG